MNGNLIPKRVIDKNGKETTVYVRQESPSILGTSVRLASPPSSAIAPRSANIADIPGPTGIHWDSELIEPLEAGWGTEDVLYNLQKNMDGAVWDTSVLEGIVITLPEVRSLMEGISVSSRPMHDVRQVENIATAYRLLHNMIREHRFSLDKKTSDRFNETLTRDEIIDPGKFRGDDTIVQSPGGEVSLMNGNNFTAPAPGASARNLHDIWNDGIKRLGDIEDPGERGLVLFAFMARNQFYFNGNKRTAKFMANGVLMSHGINAINPRNRSSVQYNEALDQLFRSGDATPIMSYLSSESRRYR